MDIKDAIGNVVNHMHLTEGEMREVMQQIMSGHATPTQIGGFLAGLRAKGETVVEITAAARVMRELSMPVKVKAEHLVDTCGTGGDERRLYNVSTAAAFVVAAAGGHVAKHGNRSMSSKSGSADLLEAIGIPLELPPLRVADCIEKVGIGFMFAPAHHPATKNVAATRVELGTRTIFNLLGPLSNPAGVRRQMIGVFSRQWTEPLAQVLKNLGAECVWVVHGSDGLDEITTTGPTGVTALEKGTVRSFEINPEDVGLPRAKPEALRGGDAATNAKAVQDVLEGKKTPFRDVALLNAAAALVVAGKADDLKGGFALATQSLDSGEAEGRLDRLIVVSNDG